MNSLHQNRSYNQKDLNNIRKRKLICEAEWNHGHPQKFPQMISKLTCNGKDKNASLNQQN